MSANKIGFEGGTKLALDFYGEVNEVSFRHHLREVMRVVREKDICCKAFQLVVPEHCEKLLSGFGDSSYSGTMLGLEMKMK